MGKVGGGLSALRKYSYPLNFFHMLSKQYMVTLAEAATSLLLMMNFLNFTLMGKKTKHTRSPFYRKPYRGPTCGRK